MRCGQVIVPERRDGRSTRTIALEVQIVLADRSPRQADPILFLGGGPGIILTDKAAAVSRAAGLRDRDIVLLDQRGVGLSRPALTCPEPTRDERLDGFESESERRDSVRACSEANAKIADLSAFSTAENAADVIDVARALGYDRWNILGVSYGTRLGLSVMRLKPEGLRAVVLDSPYPPEVNGFDDKPAMFFEQLDLVLADCAAEAVCSAAYPDLRSRLIERLSGLTETPARAVLTSNRTGASREATVSARLVLDNLRRAMYSHGALPRIPAALDALAKGEYAAFFDRLDGTRDAGGDEQKRVPGGFAAGMQLSIQCNDEQEWAKGHRRPAGDWPRPVFAAFKYAYDRPDCATWKVASAPAALHARVHSDIPTLILAGAYDPVTPPVLGEIALKGLPNGRLVNFPGLGHGLTETMCGQTILTGFIVDPQAPLDQSCVEDLRRNFRFTVPQ
nr:alpha/beta fold hydrolase [Sphingosinicella soli]